MEQTTMNTENSSTPSKKQNAFFRAVGFDPIAKQTSVRTELIAGVVTFLAMAYILTVNPNGKFPSSPLWYRCCSAYTSSCRQLHSK